MDPLDEYLSSSDSSSYSLDGDECPHAGTSTSKVDSLRTRSCIELRHRGVVGAGGRGVKEEPLKRFGSAGADGSRQECGISNDDIDGSYIVNSNSIIFTNGLTKSVPIDSREKATAGTKCDRHVWNDVRKSPEDAEERLMKAQRRDRRR